MELTSQHEDARGKMLFFSHGKMQINLLEMKKGFARGGHYHKYDQDHIILSGTLEIRKLDMKSNKETIKIVKSPSIVSIPKMVAHLFIAHDDAIFVEMFEAGYEAINYPKYRKIVEDSMKKIENPK